jgi:hypothetical protein
MQTQHQRTLYFAIDVQTPCLAVQIAWFRQVIADEEVADRRNPGIKGSHVHFQLEDAI